MCRLYKDRAASSLNTVQYALEPSLLATSLRRCRQPAIVQSFIFSEPYHMPSYGATPIEGKSAELIARRFRFEDNKLVLSVTM